MDEPESLSRIKQVEDCARDMQRRLMAHVANRTTDLGPGPMLNDAAAYADPTWFDAEKREIFRKLPILVGLSRDIPEPGDKMLFDATGPSILIVRAMHGQVSAFLNMCPHRAARVVHECRKSKLMTCPFHGWTFDLQGRLVGMSATESFDGLDRSKLALLKVPAVEWHGMIFVLARAGTDEIEIDSYLSGIADKLAMHDFARCKPVKKERWGVRANWKYVMDTFGESYHVNTLHAGTVGLRVLQNTIVYEDSPPHHRIGFARISMQPDAQNPPGEWPAAQHSMALLLFPNTILQIQGPATGPTYIFYRVFPGESVNHSISLVETYRSGEIPEEVPLASFEAEHDVQRAVVAKEDFPAAANAQANLEFAPPGFRVVYGSNEVSIQRFQCRIAELIGRKID